MAPEVQLKQPSDLKSDIYSLGMILYVLFRTHLPFEEIMNEEDHINALMTREIPFDGPEWQNVDQQAIDLIKNMLKHDLAERYSLDQVLSHPWVAQASSSV